MEHVIAKMLQDFEQGKLTRRQLIQSLALTATATVTAAPVLNAAPATPAAQASAGYVARVVEINHTALQVTDFVKNRKSVYDFYAGFLGMRVQSEDGKSVHLQVGDNPYRKLVLYERDPNELPDHTGYTIAGWDEDKTVRTKIEAEIKRRGLKLGRVSQGGGGIHVKDPAGYDVQLGGHNQ